MRFRQEEKMKTKIFGLSGLFGILIVLSFAATPIAHAANFSLTVHVDQKNKAGTIAPLQGAEISAQRCSHTSPNDEACTAWSDTIKYNTTGSNGEYTFTLTQDYRWRIVATMDNRWCDVPGDCMRGTLRHDATAITKTFQLYYPRYPGDGTVPSTEICPTRPRSAETQRKVIELGIDQSQVAIENANFSAWYHNFQELPSSPIPGYVIKLAPDDPFTPEQVKTVSQNNPNSWWILGEEPNGIQRGVRTYDGKLYSPTTVSNGTFNVNVTPGEDDFPIGSLAVINNTASGGTDAYTRVVINSSTNNTTYWTYNVTYSGGASSGTYPTDTGWGWWAAAGQTPEEYAEYYHTMSQAILQGSSGAKLIVGYFGQYYPRYLVRPWEYFDRVVTYWQAQSDWCAEPPMDAFHSNYFTFLNKDGVGVPNAERDNPGYTTEYLNLWRDRLFGGQAEAWITNERFSLGTSQNYTPSGPNGEPPQAEANRYLQYTLGNYLNPKKYDWLLFQMNFSGYSPVGGAGNLLQGVCSAQPCPMTDYGKVFANAVYRNAGWETNDLSRWTTCITDPPMFSTVAGGPTTPVKSQYALKFSTTTAYGCDIVSEKHPLDGSAGSNLLVELDYQIVQGNSDSDFYVEFYDANGVNLGSTNSCLIVSGVTNGWQHASCTFPLIAFPDAASVEFVIVAFPSGGGAKDFRYDNPSVIVLP